MSPTSCPQLANAPQRRRAPAPCASLDQVGKVSSGGLTRWVGVACSQRRLDMRALPSRCMRRLSLTTDCREGERVSQQTSPRGTFAKIADAVKAEIEAKPEMTELPTLATLMEKHGVSRGVALRAFNVLRQEGLAEPVPGGRWRVIRDGQGIDRRPLAEKIADVIRTDNIAVGTTFLSTSALATRFGVSRPTVAKALDKLAAAGLLSEARQGKRRTVLALPEREERPSP